MPRMGPQKVVTPSAISAIACPTNSRTHRASGKFVVTKLLNLVAFGSARVRADHVRLHPTVKLYRLSLLSISSPLSGAIQS